MNTRTAGQVLGAVESAGISQSLRTVVSQYYAGQDLEAAVAIREARTDDDGRKIVEAIRQGRALEVLLVAGSAAIGVVSGALAQKAVDNYSVKGVPVMAPFGLVTATAGTFAPVSFSWRSMLAAGGVGFTAGATLFKVLARPTADGGMP